MDALKDCTVAYREGQIHSKEYRQQLALLILNNEHVGQGDLDRLANLIDQTRGA